MTTEPAESFGIRLSTKFEHGMRHVTATVQNKRANEKHPLNCSDNNEAKYRARDGLTLDGWVSEYSGEFCLAAPCYMNTYRIEANRARDMAAMLDKINKAVHKAEVSEAGDVFMVFAKAIGAEWVCMPYNDGEHYSSYSDIRWHFTSLASGRDRFRFLISQAEAEQRKAGITRAA